MSKKKKNQTDRGKVRLQKEKIRKARKEQEAKKEQEKVSFSTEVPVAGEKRNYGIIIFISIAVVLMLIIFGSVTYKAVEKQMFINEQLTKLEQAGLTEEQLALAETKIDENYEAIKESVEAQEEAAKANENAEPANPELVVEENPTAEIVVKDYGTMTFELFPNDAPQSVYNFIYLAEQGFYDGLTFHRLESGFVLQGGDPNGDGTGGPGYSIQGEFYDNGIANDHKHQTGALAMARSSDPDSAGSQFYIVLDGKNASSLDGSYAVFGQMIDGEEVLQEIAKQPVEPGTSTPTEEIVIETITIDTKGVDYPEPTKLDSTPQ